MHLFFFGGGTFNLLDIVPFFYLNAVKTLKKKIHAMSWGKMCMYVSELKTRENTDR